jgi:hypothetical protein
VLRLAVVTDLKCPLIPYAESSRGYVQSWVAAGSVPGISVAFGPLETLSKPSANRPEYVAFLPVFLKLTAEALRILETNMRTGFKPNAVIGWAVYDPADEETKMTAFMQTPPNGLPKRRPGWRIFNWADFSAPLRCLNDLLNTDREAPFLTYVSQSQPMIQNLSHREFSKLRADPLGAAPLRKVVL